MIQVNIKNIDDAHRILGARDNIRLLLRNNSAMMRMLKSEGKGDTEARHFIWDIKRLVDFADQLGKAEIEVTIG